MNDSPQIQAIRARYRGSFATKTAELSALMASLNAALGNEKDTLEQANSEVKEYLHKLAGSAGMYGYSDIATACREGMQLCHEQQYEKVLNQITRISDLLANNT